jgi:hypothetical protein
MSNTVSEQIAPDISELARRTGLVVRPLDTVGVSALFEKLDHYDVKERAETFDYLKRALNETRASQGAEPVFSDE